MLVVKEMVLYATEFRCFREQVSVRSQDRVKMFHVLFHIGSPVKRKRSETPILLIYNLLI